ncbi:MAG: 2-hydroxychromene-2-carboxylate isomerase [Polyangiaceae bacterium]
MKHVDFFYDFSCPYAYLAHGRVDEACARHGATVRWRPFLLGGVFRAIGTPDQPAAHMPPSKARLNLLDMHRWADFLGVPLRMPETHPNRTVLALRAAMASDDLVRASKALYAAYWVEARDVSRPEVVKETLDRTGFDGAALVAKAEDPAIKEELRRATDEAITAGVFGAPAFVVTVRDEPGREDATELFWGQDRIELVEEMLAGKALGHGSAARDARSVSDAHSPSGAVLVSDAHSPSGAVLVSDAHSPSSAVLVSDAHSPSGAVLVSDAHSLSDEPAGGDRTVEMFFDFSSPFAYLAAVRVREVAGRAGARVAYRPFLLGGLFHAIGTPNVPLFEMPEAKRRHAAADMARWAARFGAPFRFPTRFPMNTVKPLRMVLALPDEQRPPFIDAVFRAYWGDDRDIGDPATLAEIATSLGLDGTALVARTGDDDLKRALRDATEEAARRGAFGAPTFFVGDLMFWGQDRLDMVERALQGWRPAGE